MRRIICSPGTTGNITFEEVKIPVPLENECLVRVSAFSMNRGEVSFAQNQKRGKPIGWDVVGVVEKNAARGKSWSKGTRVVGFCKRMDGWAEYVAVPEDFLAPIPETVSDTIAATLPVAGLTALYCLEKGSRLLGSRGIRSASSRTYREKI